MRDLNLSEDIEFKGKWWLPEEPNNKVPGILTVSSEGIALELLGSFSGSMSGTRLEENRPRLNPEVVVGTTGGKSVTLGKVLEMGSTGSLSAYEDGVTSPYLTTTRFFVERLFAGKHFGTEGDIRFESMDAKLSFLEEWMGTENTPFETDMDEDQHTATFTFPERVEVRVPSLNATISIASTFTFGGGLFRTLNWRYSQFLSITPDEPQDYDWYSSTIRSCQNFFTLMIGKPAFPEWLTGHVEGEHELAEDGFYQGDIEVLAHDFILNSRREFRYDPGYWSWHNVLLPYPAIESEFKDALTTWFKLSERLEAPINLYFSTLYSDGMYFEAEFLSLVQALEVFHTRMYSESSKHFDQSEFQEYVSQMCESLPEPAREKITAARLGFLNMYTLKERLIALYARTPDDAQDIVSSDPELFTKRVVATRNHLTHYSKPNKNVIQLNELYPYIVRLRMWMFILLVDSVGVKSSALMRAIERYLELYRMRLSDLAD